MINTNGIGVEVLVNGLALKEYKTETKESEPGTCSKMECYVESQASQKFEIRCFRREDDVDDFLIYFVHLDGCSQDNVLLSKWLASETISGQQAQNKLHHFIFDAIRLTDDEDVYSQYESEAVVGALGSIRVEVFKWTLTDFNMAIQGGGNAAPLPSTSSMQFNENSAKAAVDHTAGICSEGVESVSYQADGHKTGHMLAMFTFKYRSGNFLVSRDIKEEESPELPNEEGARISPARNSPDRQAESSPSPPAAELPDLPPNYDDLPPVVPNTANDEPSEPAPRPRRSLAYAPARPRPTGTVSPPASTNQVKVKTELTEDIRPKPEPVDPNLIKPDPEAANSASPRASGSGTQRQTSVERLLAETQAENARLRAQLEAQARVKREPEDIKPNLRPGKKRKLDASGAIDLTETTDEEGDGEGKGKGKAKEP